MKPKPLVYILEDDPSFRRALELVLTRLGLTARSAANAQEFQALTRKGPPNLYLIDLQLEHGDGYEIIRAIREDPARRNPIVVISGSKDCESIEKALAAGATDFITKPLDRSFLVAKLAKHVMTEEIKQQQTDRKAIPPGGRAPARISFKGKIREIDELGLKIESSNLIPTGTVLKLSGEFIAELGLPAQECLVTVVTSSLDSASETYGIQAEFDGTDAPLLERIRQWLSHGKVA